MNTRKFEYLETIRVTIEKGDYQELKDYIEDIRDAVRFDPDFEEIYMEISSGKFQETIPLIDDIIYKDLQTEFEDFEEDEPAEDQKPGIDISEFSLEFNFGDDLEEEISFEPFDDDEYMDISDDDIF